MEVIQFSASRSLQVQRFQFEIKSLISDTALLWGEITFALFGCFFWGRGSRGHQPWELVNAPLERKSTQRPERRTMHGIQQSSQLGQRLPVHSCVLRKKAEANHGAVHPPHLTKPISGTDAPDGQSLEMLSSFIPTQQYSPTYLPTCLPEEEQYCTSIECFIQLPDVTP